MNSSVSTMTFAAPVWKPRSVRTEIAQSGSGHASRSSRARTTRCQVTVPPNQSGSRSLLRPEAP